MIARPALWGERAIENLLLRPLGDEVTRPPRTVLSRFRFEKGRYRVVVPSVGSKSQL